jgi:two-component system phosphate regulon sensor histidine kinase PhoR
VWIVDDSPLDAERARRVLAGRYAVEVFADGSTVLEHLATHPEPTVVVLDWVMPGVSGIEVCRFLRAEGSGHAQIAVLLLTMQTETQQIVEGLAAGANDYLVKPYSDPELLARVDALVRWKGLLDRAQTAEASVLQLLENAPDPLIGVDDQYVIIYVNGEAQRAFGQGTKVLLGQPLSAVLPTLPLEHINDARRTARPLPDIQIDDQTFSPTIRTLPSDGQGGLTIALRNVTLRRHKESRRLDFYSIIAHDLRSPLAAMLMRTEMMLRGRRGVLSAEVISDLRKMDGHMRNLVALINDFLDFARMDEAAHKIERTRVDLTELIREIVEDFKPLVDSTHQTLSVEVDAPSLMVSGDRPRLQQVLTNLLANAIKFTPSAGKIGLRARLVDRWCEVTVSDDGPGIAAEVLPLLFQRYTRAPNAQTDTRGTGLGLLIVREIVEAHGGTVGVDSTVGQGSQFWFRIPASESAVVGLPPTAGAETPLFPMDPAKT